VRRKGGGEGRQYISVSINIRTNIGACVTYDDQGTPKAQDHDTGPVLISSASEMYSVWQFGLRLWCK
jgi:hypothetical protein